MINISAGMPRGCELNDSIILPWNIREIDLPNPSPGQFSIPIKLK